LGLVDLQQKIAARVAHGGSLADVRHEIIEPSSLGEDERMALWLYAATRPEIPLGYGKFVRADEIVALVPIDEVERSDGRRTYVHTETLPEPLIASRSEKEFSPTWRRR
jgi:hypothetical protein